MVNGNSEIAIKPEREKFIPPPGVEPWFLGTSSQCAANELGWP